MEIEPLLFLPIILSFFITFLVLPSWIKKAKKVGLIWPDMNQHSKREVPGSGGLVVIMGFTLGVLSYIALKTFVLRINTTTIEIFALLTTVLMAGLVALTDDLLGWTRGGLSAKSRVALIFLAAIPLMVINVGYTKIQVPFFGIVNLGLFYPLFIVPLGIIGASTTFNFIAGYNGLEAGQGILLVSALSIVAFFTGNSWLSLIGLCMIASLAAFLFFNKFPSKTFPGDVLTYPVGALIAIMAILGNFERIALVFFIPYIIETCLKVRGKLKKTSFGKPNKDNSLEVPYDKIYGLEHFSILLLKKIKKDGKVYQKDVVYFIHLIQIVFIVLGFVIFKQHIF